MSSSSSSTSVHEQVFDDSASSEDESSQSATSLPGSPSPLKSRDSTASALNLPSAFPGVQPAEVYHEVAKDDEGTPDQWVKRNPELVRLTGKHPFNCEARLNRLFDSGFLTPSHLFYVRNHGAVPYVDSQKAASWTLRIHGLVEREVTFSIEDLKRDFEVVTLPVTFVCAGNRRKEQNVVSKSLGFSWGAAGVSTGLFTGVYLADVLAHVKPLRPRARHAVFEGIDKLPNGPYGTSQRLGWATDKTRGILICWAMNGLPLEPDHGFPLRMVIPGQIGGRSVKWLNRIEISERESQHYLHFWDNKVLPTEVNADRARSEEKWWYDQKYIINELNTNSAIARPDHNEVLSLTASSYSSKSYDPISKTYLLQGYAYAGGGRRVARVEVSLDGGNKWALADVDYPEDIYRSLVHEDKDVFGKLDLTELDTCFCWCFWSYAVPVDDILRADEIAVRAMDEGLSGQPRDMYWNAMGMMNNWWFRVMVHKLDGEAGVLFEHPTMAGTMAGGWMERMKSEGRDPLYPSSISSGPRTAITAVKPEVTLTNPDVSRTFTRAELKSNHTAFVVNGEVYDGKDYLKDHPGGEDSILLMGGGGDATEDFMAIHSDDAKVKLREFHIGSLANGEDAEEDVKEDEDSASFLHPTSWKTTTLAARRSVSHDSEIFTFVFPPAHAQTPLGVPCGQHVFVRLRARGTGEAVQRAYTPVSRGDAKGEVELLVKIYLPCDAWPKGGKMSSALHALEIGDEVEFKGPVGSFVHVGGSGGEVMLRGVRRSVRRLGLICGGSGITPIIQVLRGVLSDSASPTEAWLLTSNKTAGDILLRSELDSYLSTHGSRYRAHHAVTSPTEDEEWEGSIGRITDEMLMEHMPRHDGGKGETLILACGPEGMVEVVKGGLMRLGWDVDRELFIF